MYEIESRILKSQPTLTMHGLVENEDIDAWLQKAYRAVERTAHLRHAHLAGPPYARYRSIDENASKFEVEAGFPVMLSFEGEDGVVASMLPEGPAAVTVHFGPCEAIEPAYAAIEAWLAQQGAAAVGPAWEVYFSGVGSETDPATQTTEIYQPYLPA